MKILRILWLILALAAVWLADGSRAQEPEPEEELIEAEEFPLKNGVVDATAWVAYPALEEDTFLPALAHMIGEELDGDIFHLVEMEIENHADDDLTVVVKAALQGGFSEWAKETVTVPAGETVVVGLTPVFKEDISLLSEQKPGAIEWTVETVEGKTLATKTKKITLASRNDMLISEDAAALCAVFVTPNDPWMDEVLAAAREAGLIDSFDGYQSEDPEKVCAQINAVWDVLSALGLHYRSATTSFLDGKNLECQRIYYPCESLQGTGANCIDGTVLLASLLERVELAPSFVFVPGHVFLAVALQDPETVDAVDMLFIETTMLGEAEGEQSSFEDAVATAQEEYEEALADESYEIVDIGECRAAGILPYPYYEKLHKDDFDIRAKLGLKEKE